MKRETASTYTALTINKNSLFEYVSCSSKYPLRMVVSLVRFTDCKLQFTDRNCYIIL